MENIVELTAFKHSAKKKYVEIIIIKDKDLIFKINGNKISTNIVEALIGKIPENFTEYMIKENEYEKQKLAEAKEEAKKQNSVKINEVFKTIQSELPFKIKYEDETTIACIIKDEENKVVTPYIVNDNGFKKLIRSQTDIREFFKKFSNMLFEEGIEIDDVNELWKEFEKRSLQNIHNMENHMIDDFKTFSFNKDEWKTSYIDPIVIDNADSNTSEWDKFGRNLGNDELNNEAYSIFKAWVWTIFDENAINHNRQALWMYGDGFDGKSVVTKVISSILAGEYEGTTGTGSIGIGQLNKEFWATSFYGKSLVTINEVGDSDLFSKKSNDGPGGKLHQITGHDIVSVEGKGKQPFEAKIKSRIILFANCAPTFNSMQNNEITRLIPVHVSKSYFVGLDNNNKDFVFEDWGKKLYEQRFAFLKKCREEYLKRIDPQQMLISISKDYQNEYFQKSEYIETIEDVSSYITNDKKTNKQYSAQSVGLFIKYICDNLFKIKCGGHTISNIIKIVNITKHRRIIDGKKIGFYSCTLNSQVLNDYNNWCKNNRSEHNCIKEIFVDATPITNAVIKTTRTIDFT